MRFTDGMEINTDGELRVIRMSDGWYVTGRGTLCAVDSYEEGQELIKRLSPSKEDD